MPDRANVTDPKGGGERITVWPCDHGGVEVEPGGGRERIQCAQCGATPRTYVPASQAEALEGALRELVEAADRLHEDATGPLYAPEAALCKAADNARSILNSVSPDPSPPEGGRMVEIAPEELVKRRRESLDWSVTDIPTIPDPPEGEDE